MPDLTLMIKNWEEKIKDAHEQMEYLKKKANEQWIEIGIMEEAIKRLKGDDYS